MIGKWLSHAYGGLKRNLESGCFSNPWHICGRDPEVASCYTHLHSRASFEQHKEKLHCNFDTTKNKKKWGRR